MSQSEDEGCVFGSCQVKGSVRDSGSERKALHIRNSGLPRAVDSYDEVVQCHASGDGSRHCHETVVPESIGCHMKRLCAQW